MSEYLGCLRWLFLAFMLAFGLVTLVRCSEEGIVVRFETTGEEILEPWPGDLFLPPAPDSEAILSQEVDVPQAPTGNSNANPPRQPIIGQIVGEPMNCTGLRPTSPTDGFAYAPTTFYWDAAPDLDPAETTYTVVVYDIASGAVVTAASTAGDQSNLTIDLGSQLLAFSDQFMGALSWDIVATRGGDDLSCVASANGGAPIGVDIRNSPFEPGKEGGGSDDTQPVDGYEPPEDPPDETPGDGGGEG